MQTPPESFRFASALSDNLALAANRPGQIPASTWAQLTASAQPAATRSARHGL